MSEWSATYFADTTSGSTVQSVEPAPGAPKLAA